MLKITNKNYDNLQILLFSNHNEQAKLQVSQCTYVHRKYNSGAMSP